MTDPHIRAVEIALAKYKLANSPTAERNHALLTAVMDLVAQKSGLVVSMRVGEGLITRSPDERRLLQRN